MSKFKPIFPLSLPSSSPTSNTQICHSCKQCEKNHTRLKHWRELIIFKIKITSESPHTRPLCLVFVCPTWENCCSVDTHVSTYHFSASVTRSSSVLYPAPRRRSKLWKWCSLHWGYRPLYGVFMCSCGLYSANILSEWLRGHVIKIFWSPPFFFSSPCRRRSVKSESILSPLFDFLLRVNLLFRLPFGTLSCSFAASTSQFLYISADK